MNNKLKKILSLTLISNLLICVPTFASTKNYEDEYYNYSKSFELDNYNFQIEDDSLIVKLNNTSRSINNFKEKKEIDDVISNNPDLEQQLIDAIKQGHKPAAISISEVYVEETLNDETNEIESRFLTNGEVKDLNDNPNSRAIIGGETGYKGKLKLFSTLWTNIEDEKHSFSLTALWDVSGYNGSAESSPAVGDDFIALCWPNTYEYTGSSNASGYYNAGLDNYTDMEFYRASVVGNSGLSWGFSEKVPNQYVFVGADRITAFAHIATNNSTAFYKTFTAQYVHTYQDKQGNVSMNASSSGAAGGITVSNVDKQWTLVSPITVNIK